jgi:uncharacterized membrane protein
MRLFSKPFVGCSFRSPEFPIVRAGLVPIVTARMNLGKILPRRETRAPLLALALASGVSVALVGARIWWTTNPRYGLLLWNLFLAWLPLVFSLLTCRLAATRGLRDWRFGAAAAAWLIFFPNAPYIFTDVVHLPLSFWAHYWVDLAVILTCAITGLVLGFLSLFLLQSLVASRWGRTASWGFVGAASALSGFGVFLGRFLRFNSWDVFAQPSRLYHSVSGLAANPPQEPSLAAFPALFALFVFVSYVLLYGLTHLQPPPPVAESVGPPPTKP